MKTRLGKSALCAIVFLIHPLIAMAADDWQQLTHGGLSFSIPADWEQLKQRQDEGQWGLHDKESRQGILFGITRERHPERQFEKARKDGMKVEQMARLDFGGVGAERYRISGNSKDLGEVEFQVAVLDSMLADGDRVTYSAGAVNRSSEAVAQTLERVMASVQPTESLISTLTGSSRQQIFDGALSIEVRNNWERTDYSDEASWEPPLFSLWGGRLISFEKGYGLTGGKGLLGKLQDAQRERVELFGQPGWRISGTGVAITYADKMRTKAVPAETSVQISDTCLAPGERFGYAITASEAQLAEYREEIERIVDSIKFTPPEGAGPCDELLPYDWVRDLRIGAPRSWSRDMNEPYRFSFFGRDLAAASELHLYIQLNEGAHPVTGEGREPAQRVANLTIDGYPATHYRLVREDNGKHAAGYDYYVLDTRMRYQQGSFGYLYFDFQSEPPASGELEALQREILTTVKLGAGWSSETPVAQMDEAQQKTQPAPVVEASSDTLQEPAVQTEQPAAQPDPDSPKARYEAARALRAEGAELQQRGQLKAAVEKYRQSLKLFPDDSLEQHIERIRALLKE